MLKGWKPKKNGTIYCSPLCGGGCTHVAFENATRQAKVFARIMGKGFKPRVWENLGWHWEIKSKCERLSISSSNGESFLAMLNTTPNSGGRWIAYATTPKLAAKRVLKLAKQELNEINETLTEIGIDA